MVIMPKLIHHTDAICRIVEQIMKHVQIFQQVQIIFDDPIQDRISIKSIEKEQCDSCNNFHPLHIKQ